MRVGPIASAPPKPAYAPASPTIWHRMPTIVPSRLHPSSHVLHLPAAVRHRDQVLGAGLDPLHRPLQPQRGRDRDAVLGREPGLAAERAADVRRDDAEPRGIEVEHRRDARSRSRAASASRRRR